MILVVRMLVEIVDALMRGIEAANSAGSSDEDGSAKSQVKTIMAAKPAAVQAKFDALKEKAVG